MANWSALDEYSLWKIFSYLQIRDICKVSPVCQNWYFVANDDFLWKLKFSQHFNLKNNQLLSLPPSSKSWKAEVKRLLFTIPSASNSEELKSPHQLEITNVCFSRDGNFFATCGRDSRVVLWNSSGSKWLLASLRDYGHMLAKSLILCSPNSYPKPKNVFL